MSVETRKIGYYSIDFKLYHKGKNQNPVFDPKYFTDILNFIVSLNSSEEDSLDKLIKVKNEKKSYFLDSWVYNEEYSCHNIIFKSCKYGHFPPYMNSETGSERNTSKLQHEGETEKTHVCIKFLDEEALVLLEERRSGIGMSKIIKYLNEMSSIYCKREQIKRKYTFEYMKIASKGFLDALNNVRAVKGVEIYTAKKLSGDEALNYISEEDPFIKNEVIIKLQAIPREGILKRTIKKIYESVVSSESNITRVRIKGDVDGGNNILDSQFCRETKFLEAQLDIDGTINSDSIFSQMMNLIKD